MLKKGDVALVQIAINLYPIRDLKLIFKYIDLICIS